jgi:RimJ/RimL family protein N-acetyltransferase
LDKVKRIIDLKKEEAFIEAYVSLRNCYANLLLTKAVNATETKEWLKRADIETRAILLDSELVGATVLYLHRNGEIAFFAKEANQGIGEELLRLIEQVAREKRLKSVWAWVLNNNFPAQRVFEKNGFVKEVIVKRMHEGVMKEGIRYRKILQIES